MEMGITSFDRTFAGDNAARAEPADSGVMSDWAGLRARFLAGEALRRAGLSYAASESQAIAKTGCFDPATADKLAAYANAEPDVNPTALADGKAHGGTEFGDAGAPMPGNRG